MRHSWNKHSKYQRLGNFFIGLSPVVGCSLVLAGLGFWLVPNLMQLVLNFGQHLSSGRVIEFPTNFVSDKWWAIILFILLATNISWGGFDLSPADLQNTSLGAWLWVAILIGSTIFLTLISPQGSWLIWLSRLGWIWTILLGFALILALILHCLLRIVIRFTT